MKQRPILFNAEMVQAILNGNKTQTRRVVKGNESYKDWSIATRVVDSEYLKQQLRGANESSFVLQEQEGELVDCKWQPISCPYGKIGDQLWVRETFQDWSNMIHGKCRPIYRADNPKFADGSDVVGPWTPSIHMPRWASRIQLEITNIRVERLNDISEKDAKAEGVKHVKGGFYHNYMDSDQWDSLKVSAKASFFSLWESINGAGSWDFNPWVWVVEFKRI